MNSGKTFINNKNQVVTKIEDYEILSSQSKKSGGDGIYPSPGNLMIAALLNCSLGSLMIFCLKREINTEGLEIDFDGDFNMEKLNYDSITFNVKLPKDFPEKYISSVDKVINTCPVGMAMNNMPKINIEII